MFSFSALMLRLLQKVWNRSVTATGRSLISTPLESVSPIDLAAADAAAGQGHVERLGIMIAAAAGVDGGSAAELAHPDHERFVEHAALLQVGDQRGERLVDFFAEFFHAGEVVVVGVPAVLHDFDERDARFDQAAGQQAAGAEIVAAVGIAGLIGFFGEIEGFHFWAEDHFHGAIVQFFVLGSFFG